MGSAGGALRWQRLRPGWWDLWAGVAREAGFMLSNAVS